MPHKVNPINFENSEGNIYVANSLFSMFSSKLPISRLQRDLTDSTISRNFGVALSHCIISYNSLLKGLGKLEINRETIDADLDDNWSILMEAVQCVMKTEFIDDSYEIIKQIVEGEKIDKNAYLEIVDSLELSEKNKNKLLNLIPRTYLGNL
jgi:adenylosuccinate lyase